MESTSQLQEVKKFRLIKKGKILLLIFFSCLGTVCGAFLWYQILLLTDFKTNISVPLLTVIGTAIGFYIGNLISKYSENNAPFFGAMFIVSMLHIPVFSLSVTTYKTFENHLFDNVDLLIFGISVIIYVPFLMYLILREISYCENCKKSYQSMTVFASKIVSPYQILSLLQNKQEFSNVSDLEENRNFSKYENQIKVEVKASYCPHCYDAIVNGVLTCKAGIFKKKEKEIFFYSDFWTGELFKKVFQIENNTVRNKVAEIDYHHKSSKLITAMEFYFSKIQLIKSLIPIVLFLGGILILILCLPNNLFSLVITKIADEGINLKLFFAILFATLMFCGSALFFIFTSLKIFDKKHQLIINSIGVEWFKLKIGYFYWQDIEKISLSSQPLNDFQKLEFICIKLVNREKYFNKSTKLTKILMKSKKLNYDIAIPFTCLKPSANEAWEYISQLCESKHYIRRNANPYEYIKSESN